MMRGRRNRRRNRGRRASPVGARRKLNVADLNGCPILAAIVGASAESGPGFLLALIVLVMGGDASGKIRPRREDRSMKKRSPRPGSGRGMGFPIFYRSAIGERSRTGDAFGHQFLPRGKNFGGGIERPEPQGPGDAEGESWDVEDVRRFPSGQLSCGSVAVIPHRLDLGEVTGDGLAPGGF